MSYANVWTADTTRPGILDAISKRRIYASTDLIVADVRIGTHFMLITGQCCKWRLWWSATILFSIETLSYFGPGMPPVRRPKRPIR